MNNELELWKKDMESKIELLIQKSDERFQKYEEQIIEERKLREAVINFIFFKK